MGAAILCLSTTPAAEPAAPVENCACTRTNTASSRDAYADRDLGGLIGIGRPDLISDRSADQIACITITAWALVRANLMLMEVIRSSKMSDQDKSAFPNQGYGLRAPEGGMTLRDYFAAKVYAALISGGYWPIDTSREEQAIMAYKHADAMIAARNQESQQ